MASLSVLNILRTIKERGAISRTDLQHLTGLSWGTITNTTRELLNRNLIREQGALATKAGRKPVKLALNPDSHVLLGIDLAPHAVGCIALNLAGETLWFEQRRYDLTVPPPQVLELAGNMLIRALDERSVRGRQCLGAGVAVQGSVDVKGGVMQFAPRMPGWKNVAIRELLQPKISAPILIEHDPNCLALAERWFGSAAAHDDVLCINLSEGIGMGILLHGEVYRGSQNHAGEFGHMTVDPNGPACACGDKGCVESFCSMPAIVEFIRSLPGEQSAGLRALLEQRTPTLEELVSAAPSDTATRAAFERVGHYLGIGLANLVDLLNPSLLVLCGPLTAAQEYFLPAVHKQLEKHAWKHSSREVMISNLGDRGIVKGACGIVLQNIFDQQLLAPIELLQV